MTLLEWRVTMFEIFKKHVALAPLPAGSVSLFWATSHLPEKVDPYIL